MSRTALIALTLACGCAEDPAAPYFGPQGNHGGPTATTETCPAAPVSTAPEVHSGRVVYDAGKCPVAGRDDGVDVPDGAIVQALECDGSTCYDAADLLFVDDGQAYLIACNDSPRYEIRWLSVE